MDVQWYPGQMAKAKRVLRENLKLVDAVIEVLDARLPASSRNPDIRELLEKRPVVAVLTHPDLADPVQTAAWLYSLREDYFAVAVANSSTGEGIKKLLQLLRTLPRRRKHEQRPLRLIIVGIPNVGKSSLINRLIGRSATQTGDKPGITKQPQWVSLQAGLELLDTPGMLWPKISCRKQAFRLAAAGAVKDEILDPVELGIELVSYMQRHFGEQLQQRYSLENFAADPQGILADIAKRRGCLLKGGAVDLEAAARLLIKDLRDGRLGRITLEKPGEQEDGTEELCDDDDRGDSLFTE